MGTVPEYKAVHSLRLKNGRFILPGDIKEKRRVCVVDSTISDELRIRVGGEIKIGEDGFRVIGIVTSQGMTQGQIIIPLSTNNEAISSTKRNLEIVILTDGKPDALQDEIQRILKSRFPDKKKKGKQFNLDNERFMVSTAEGLLEIIKNQQWTSRMIVLGIGLVTLILAGGGIVNLIMLAVRQRYKEIGIMRACGAKRQTIFYLFLLEGVLLSLYGLVLGGGVAFFYVGLTDGVRFHLFSDAFFWSAIICLPLGLCGYYPAMMAASISPCEAIREG